MTRGWSQNHPPNIMELITRKMLASKVAERWAQIYPANKYPDVPNKKYSNKQEILRSLLELGSDPNPDDVDRVIGNGSWTSTNCYECGNKNIDVLQIGEKPNYDSSTTYICKECANKAKEFFR